MISSWIEAMRLRTLPVSAAGVVCACAFAVEDGSFVPAAAALCLGFALLCQIASNFANEYFDYAAGRDRAGREGPRRGVTEGDISPGAMRAAICITLAAAAAVGLCLVYFGGVWLIAAGVVIGLGALAYSTGPYPLSTHCLGEVAVVLFFGIVPVTLTYYVQTLTIDAAVVRGAVAMGLMGANVLIVNNTRDIPDDRAVGKHTLATAFGTSAMSVLYAVNAIAAAAFTFYFMSGGWTAVPGFYIGLSFVVAVALRRRKGAALTPLLGITSIMMFVYAAAMLLKSVV